LLNGDTVLYYGGHPIDHAVVSYAAFNLEGTETLTGRFYEYDSTGWPVETFPQFIIDLSLVDVSAPVIGASYNRISYTFADFSSENEMKYREFLKRVWPIMYKRLGPPAESFNCLIKDVGTVGYFMVVKNGREFWSDESFIPRLIVHEFVHAWKGGYTFTTDENWNYDNPLSGFEEGSAEGMAFEIIHEYVRSYPDDSASIQLLNWRPYQYWSSCTTYYDSIKFNRWTGAGDFWTPPSGVYTKYSIAATTFQILTKQDPDFYRKMMQEYYDRINTDSSWRSNRKDLLDIWAEIVPYINGIETKIYLDSIPVFQGHKLDEGIYVMNVIYQYGTAGSQQIAVTYVINDGRAYWGILKTKINDYALPEWVRYDPGYDAYYYIDTQDEQFTVDVFTDNSLVLSIENKTNYARRPDGTANGFGWKLVEALGMSNFPVGLYREEVTFTNYIQYDENATEDFYFFGTDDYSQDKTEEYVIMIGVDGVQDGTIEITIDEITYTQPIVRGTAIFRSYQWPLDMEGEFPIVVTGNNGNSHTYYRTVLEAGTYHGYYQHQFIIVDRNFNGLEDQFEENFIPLEIESITGPTDPVSVGIPVELIGTFTYPGAYHTYTATFDWGDGEISTVPIVPGDSLVSDSHIYSTPGVYSVTLTVVYGSVEVDSMVFRYVVVYSPDGGFITGGGWFTSSEGAFPANPSLTGKATFGFVAKYKKGTAIPTGTTTFTLHVAGLTFHSTEYDWLVVAGARAQFKGVGRINGTGDYGFLVTAIDGALNGGGDVDKFRIKIWDILTGIIIYDNQLGVEDDGPLATAIEGGNIVIHGNKGGTNYSLLISSDNNMSLAIAAPVCSDENN
jgi:PKD repeat protein